MSNQKRIFLVLFSLLAGMGLGALALLSGRSKPVYVSPYQPGSTPPPDAPGPTPEPIVSLPTPSPTEPGQAGAEKKNTVTVYRIVDGPDGPVLRPETKEAVGDDFTRLAAAIASMAQGENPPLPKDTRLLRLKVTGDTALLDLSPELKENFSGGDRAELLVVNALVAVGAQLPGIKQVQIFVDGQAIESLGGMQSLLEPFPVPKK
ncbi:GerMN domain-containing protein [Armatimonas rosea]|uniref:Spore germination protein GerM n=1 Tax=Armatimonas rosea TaxID=685828 RepID=A0A7W9W8C1_ARMRO|nr:spore germination protein GerM [Armatimonas rosea]